MNRLINKNGKISPKYKHVLEKYPNLLLDLISKTKFLDIFNPSLHERVYCFVHNIYEPVMCEYCLKNKKLFRRGGPYSFCCSAECLTKFTALKIIKSLTQKDETGKSVSERASIKANQTKKERGITVSAKHLHTSEIQEKIRNSNTGNKKLSNSLKEHHKTERDTDKYNERFKKLRETREARGDWLPESLKSDYNIYCRKVRTITNRQNISSLPNFELRGRGKDKYHLDHIIPKIVGFRNNISPEIIGDISNLQFLSEYENCSKQGKFSLCS